MEEAIQNVRDLRRHLNSIEHMIYVSCKFTKTTEMMRRVMETIVTGYEQFFAVAYELHAKEEDFSQSFAVHHKIQVLSSLLEEQGLGVDLSDYFLLKRLLMSDFDSIGEYRKNLCMISYVDGDEFVVNLPKLLEFYTTLKMVCSCIGQQQQQY